MKNKIKAIKRTATDVATVIDFVIRPHKYFDHI